MLSSRAIHKSLLTLYFAVVGCSLTPSVTTALAQSNGNEPFGLSFAGAAPETASPVMWKELLVQVDKDLLVIAGCRAEPQSCSSTAAPKFLAVVKEGERQQGRNRIAYINRAANFAMRALDSAHSDNEWRSPLDILAKGAGDCKHSAVLKYAALREAGIPENALRIVLVKVKSTHQQHAILAVRTEGRWLLLDNRTSTLVESYDVLGHYDPLYALDQTGVRQFALNAGPNAGGRTVQ